MRKRGRKEVRIAADLTVVADAHGAICLRFHDKAGRIFAVNRMDRAIALFTCEAIINEVQQAALTRAKAEQAAA